MACRARRLRDVGYGFGIFTADVSLRKTQHVSQATVT